MFTDEFFKGEMATRCAVILENLDILNSGLSRLDDPEVLESDLEDIKEFFERWMGQLKRNLDREEVWNFEF